jgi:hypothetical protein
MRRFLIVTILILAVLASAFILLWRSLPDLAEKWIAENHYGVLEGPVELGAIRPEPGAKFRIEGIRGALRTRQGAVPFTMDSVVSVDPVTFFLQGKPVRFSFGGLKPEGSVSSGVCGEFLLRFATRFRFELTARMDGLSIEDLRWLDPASLEGASGAVRGTIRYAQEGDDPPVFEMRLDAPEPGGLLQAKFFDLFLPYLPASAQKKIVQKLAGKGERLVQFRQADLAVSMPSGDRVKVLLHILILDYNLNLTLNAEIRTDSKNAFFKIAQYLGMVEVKL